MKRTMRSRDRAAWALQTGESTAEPAESADELA